LNQLLDNILDRPKAQKIGILVAAIVLIAALYYSFLYSPRSDQIAQLAESVEVARNEKSAKTQKAANLPRLRKDLQQLDAELKKAVADRDVASKLSALTLDPMHMSVEEFAGLLKFEYEKYESVVKLSGARVE